MKEKQNTNIGLNVTLPESIDTIIQNVLGPTSKTLGEDLNNVYIKGRDKILNKSMRKIEDPSDKKIANLRIARDVFFNGAFTDNEITAEYFGGILASSRTKNGQDDSGIFFLDIIKSLSAKQLQLHYLIYKIFNNICLQNEDFSEINLHQGTKLKQISLHIPLISVLEILDITDKEFSTAIFGLKSKELLGDYFRTEKIYMSKEEYVPVLIVNPTLLGIQLFAIAYNKDYKDITSKDFGYWENQEFDIDFEISKEELIKKLKIKEYKKEP